MRILHVIPWLSERYGGPAVLVPQAARALDQRGHHSEIATTVADGRGVVSVPTGEPVAWHGATATFHPLSPPRWYKASLPLLVDLWRRTATFDVVHIHYLYRFHGVAASATARLRGVPYVVQAHGSLDPWHRREKRRAKDIYHALIEDPIIRNAAAILCTSERERQHVRDLGYSVPAWVIPVGIELAELRTDGTPGLRERFGIPLHSPIVTFLGRISAKKGVPLLVEAFERIVDRFPTAHLVIAGPDDEGIGRSLMSRSGRPRIGRRISFVGHLAGPEKRALLQQSSAFVLPSADESFGLAVAEAMAVGCPVVVTPQVALEDVVLRSGAGIVAERSVEAIAAGIAQILEDPARARAMGEAAARAADARFAWPIVASEMEAMYEAVVESHRHRRSKRTANGSPPKGTVDRVPYRCLRCSERLVTDGHELRCAACGWELQMIDGVRVFLIDTKAAEHDEIDHHHSAEHKAAQAAHFDRAGEEAFETSRPHGSPRLYRFFLGEKFRRAVEPIRPHLARGPSALVVCGGSGMDAEYLARAGAQVTTSDLSRGAAVRARNRAQRFGVAIDSIVADVECLPFEDQSVDLVAVHDGLHHLADPYRGLAEMARVARRWVVVTEPAKAAATRLAVRLGLALEREEAGNRVARLDPPEVAAFLAARGFTPIRVERYAMYYPHHPGRVFDVLSAAGLFPVVRIAWRIANSVIGRFGNKMVVVAERTSAQRSEQAAA